MSNRLPWALFAVSLALNLFFVGGVGYSWMTTGRLVESPDARLDTVAEELSLTAAEKQGLIELRGRMREVWSAMRSQNGSVRAATLEELASDDFDREKVLQLTRERYELRSATIVDSMQELHDYLTTLTPEQRRQFVDMAQDRRFFRNLFGRSANRKQP